MGVQVLRTIGWRGDTSLPQSENVEKSTPPANKEGRTIIRSKGSMWWRAGDAKEGWYKNEQVEAQVPMDYKFGGDGELRVVAGVFFQRHTGATCSWMCDPKGEVSTQGWIHGVARPNTPLPACLEMLGL